MSAALPQGRGGGGGGIARRTAMLAAVFLVLMTAILTWGLATGAYGGRVSGVGALRQLDRDPGFANLVRALNLIRDHYIKRPDMSQVYAGAISGALRSLNDPYSGYFTPQAYTELNSSATGLYSGIGVQVEADSRGVPVVVHVFPGTPAATTRFQGAPARSLPGLQPGDRLVAVNGQAVKGLSLAEVAARIQGPVGTAVRVEVSRMAAGGRPRRLEFRLIRRAVAIVTVSAHLLPERIGYLAISGFNAKTPEEVGAALAALRRAGMRGLVLDLRDNPGGVLDAAVATGAYFLPRGPVTYLQGRQGRQVFGLRRTKPLGLPMVVLVNRYTASAAEVLAGAIQDDHVAPLVGHRTFGKGIVQRVYGLEGGAGLRLTIAQYYTPKGRDINGKGLLPDVSVPARGGTAAGSGRVADDSPLKAALALLNREVGRRAA